MPTLICAVCYASNDRGVDAKVTFDMERYKKYRMPDVFNDGLKQSLEEVGGIVKHWTDIHTSQDIFEVQSMPKDKPLHGLYWILVDETKTSPTS